MYINIHRPGGNDHEKNYFYMNKITEFNKNFNGSSSLTRIRSRRGRKGRHHWHCICRVFCRRLKLQMRRIFLQYPDLHNEDTPVWYRQNRLSIQSLYHIGCNDIQK